jgi:hypothetical protein
MIRVKSRGELPVASRILRGGFGRQLHTLSCDGQRIFATDVVAPLNRKLCADVWQATDEPYLILEVPAADITSLWAGFETAADGLVLCSSNPYAVIERYADMIILMLHGQGCWTPLPFPEWPNAGDCQIFLLADGLLPNSGADREPTLVDLINAGEVLVAVNPINAPAPSPTCL